MKRDAHPGAGVQLSRGRAAAAAAILIVASSAVVLLGARPYAGGWWDGSRLATVESLVDRGTFAIDDSIFVLATVWPASSPYGGRSERRLRTGTKDKVFVDGHFYSDKTPVPAVWMAAVYAVGKACVGWNVREDSRTFTRAMTILFAGAPFVVAMWSIYGTGRLLGLNIMVACWLAISLGFATTALPYTRHVNNPILLLGVATLLQLQVTKLAREKRPPRRVLLAAIGTLAGLGYAIDIPTGPILLACTSVWVIVHLGRTAVVPFAAGAAPWVMSHHVLAWIVTQSVLPPAMIPEYLQWPGSPWSAANLTGVVTSGSPLDVLDYAARLLVGRRGFLWHNPTTMLACVAAPLLLSRRVPEAGWLAAGVASGIATLLVYAVTSNNFSGGAMSIRWFVPLLAPAYFAVAVLLRERPHCLHDFVLLSLWGGLVASLMWRQGPWTPNWAPDWLFWAIVVGSTASWACLRGIRRMRPPPPPECLQESQ